MNKEFYKTYFYAGVSFGLIMGLFFGVCSNLMIGVLSGIISGLLFGLTISIFVEIQGKKFRKIRTEVTKGKPLIMDGGANHFAGAETVGGWIYLTPDEIIFISHAFNIQTHQTVIPLKQIVGLKPVKTLGIVPNGLQITTDNGTTEKFVINNRRNWINKLNEMISGLDS